MQILSEFAGSRTGPGRLHRSRRRWRDDVARVELDRVRKAYGGGQVAVADATFEAADGELIVLVGPSGCGKSTLLRIIAGLESPTSGTVRIGGRIVNEVAPKDRDVAMVFQSYALYPHMTVAENLGFSLKLRGHSRGELARRVRESAEVLGLAGLLERLPRELSGGQRQRVALGRALVRDPAVFLLDEPLSNLDAKLRAGVRTEIARLHRRLGATMIYVTHDQIEAMTLGQRIVVLDRGELQQIDTPMRVYERPANLFVAGFIGSPAMNFLRGRIVRQDGLQLELAVARVHLANSGGTGGELAPAVGGGPPGGTGREHYGRCGCADAAVSALLGAHVRIRTRGALAPRELSRGPARRARRDGGRLRAFSRHPPRRGRRVLGGFQG